MLVWDLDFGMPRREIPRLLVIWLPHSMVASGKSDLIKSSSTEALGSMLPCSSEEVRSCCFCMWPWRRHSVTTAITPGRSSPKPTHVEGEDWTPPLNGGVTKSHCRRAWGMGSIVAATFGKYDQPQMGDGGTEEPGGKGPRANLEHSCSSLHLRTALT